MNKNLPLHSSGKIEYLKALKEQYDKKVAEINKSTLSKKDKAKELKEAKDDFWNKVGKVKFSNF